jgi:hypothetical protein
MVAMQGRLSGHAAEVGSSLYESTLSSGLNDAIPDFDVRAFTMSGALPPALGYYALC